MDLQQVYCDIVYPCWNCPILKTQTLRSDRAALGISMTMLGGLCFAIQDAGIKWLSAELAVPQFWLWQSPSPGEYLQLFAVAFFGVIAQFSVTKAYAVASPSLVAPFEYTALIWAAPPGSRTARP